VSLDADVIAALPKVALHDHLDGGLRPQTVVELAAEAGHGLPTVDPEALGRWFFESADSGSLVRYLETFEHTLACMQTREHLVRVAREFVEDQAADGVVYAEARWAPAQHLAGGLTLQRAVEAVRDGLAEGMDACARAGRRIVAQQIVTSMRHLPADPRIPQLAVDHRHDSVCGFDIAGAEDGFPPSLHAASFDFLRRAGVPFTIHAGEAFGTASIFEAVQVCGATRIGHGVRLVDDIERSADGYVLSDLAAWIRDRRIPLEVCPTSNVQTGVCDSIATHPFGLLAEAGFRVTVSCDNRLMSATTLSREFGLLAGAFGYGLADLRRFTLNAARSAFYAYDKRSALVRDVIEPGFSRFA
jgi:adenosine deaminase